MSSAVVKPKSKLEQSGINRIIQVVGMVVIFGAVLFGCAGRLDWWQGWAFIAIYFLSIVANGVWSLTHNPDIINERGKMGKNAQSWDKIIGVLYTLLLIAAFVVSGLDTRFGWSSMALIWNIVGGVGVTLSMAMVFWVMAANSFLTTFVRIQDDRGQYTVTGGPYRYVRHPMYAGLLVFFITSPLLLGSWWALIPSLLNLAVMVVRTSLEDRLLQRELPDYPEYTKIVRYRLVPGIW